MNAQELTDAIKAHVVEQLAPHLTEAQRGAFSAIIRDGWQLEINLQPINVHPTRSAVRMETDVYLEIPDCVLAVKVPSCDYDEYETRTPQQIAALLVQRLEESTTPLPPPPPKPKTAYELLQEENAALRALLAGRESRNG